jgi:hypothetical protein
MQYQQKDQEYRPNDRVPGVSLYFIPEHTADTRVQHCTCCIHQVPSVRERYVRLCVGGQNGARVHYAVLLEK